MKKILLLITALVSFTVINAQLSSVDFEDNTVGTWTFVQTNTSQTFVIENVTAGNGNTTLKAAQCQYDSNLVLQDERIVSPAMDFTAITSVNVSFIYMMSYHWGVAPNDNYDLNLLISIDGGNTWSEIWDESMDSNFTSTSQNFQWLPISFDLSNYAGQSDVRLTFQYTGTDGAQGGFDEIVVSENTSASVNDDILSSSISIFPTATTENFTIKNESNIALTSVSLFDVNGRVVFTQNLDNLIGEKSINVSNLSTGMYFVELSSANAKTTKKLIKK